MRSSQVAAAMGAAGVAFAWVAVLWGVVLAWGGAPLLLVAPLCGLPVAAGVHALLRRSRRGDGGPTLPLAATGIAALVALAIGGVSFGGLPLLVTAVLLALSAALTPKRAAA